MSLYMTDIHGEGFDPAPTHPKVPAFPERESFMDLCERLDHNPEDLRMEDDYAHED